MNELKCWVTRRHNGLYLVTAFKPIIEEVMGTGHNDAYVRYGDPVGYINIPYEFAMSVFPDAPQVRVQPKRGVMFGGIAEPITHLITRDPIDDLYRIYYDADCYIDHVCPWFIKRMFGILKVLKQQPVHFSGRMRE